MTEKEIQTLKAQGYHYYRIAYKFGKKMYPYFCYAKNEAGAVEVFNRIIAKKWLGAKPDEVRQVNW
jgi:hypothetical protein